MDNITKKNIRKLKVKIPGRLLKMCQTIVSIIMILKVDYCLQNNLQFLPIFAKDKF